MNESQPVLFDAPETDPSLPAGVFESNLFRDAPEDEISKQLAAKQATLEELLDYNASLDAADPANHQTRLKLASVLAREKDRPISAGDLGQMALNTPAALWRMGKGAVNAAPQIVMGLPVVGQAIREVTPRVLDNLGLGGVVPAVAKGLGLPNAVVEAASPAAHPFEANIRSAHENVAGLEADFWGLGQMVEKGVRKLGRVGGPAYSEEADADKLLDLDRQTDNALALKEASAGRGPLASKFFAPDTAAGSLMDQAGESFRPENAQSITDTGLLGLLAFGAAGRGASLTAKGAAKALVPAIEANATAAKAAALAEQAVRKVKIAKQELIAGKPPVIGAPTSAGAFGDLAVAANTALKVADDAATVAKGARGQGLLKVADKAATFGTNVGEKLGDALAKTVGYTGRAGAETINATLNTVNWLGGYAAGIGGIVGMVKGGPIGSLAGWAIGEGVARNFGKIAAPVLATSKHVVQATKTLTALDTMGMGNTTRAIYDLAKAAPTFVKTVGGAGVAMDLPFAIATSETPEEFQNQPMFGTALHVLPASFRVMQRGITGQLIAPRNWKAAAGEANNKPTGTFPEMDAEHASQLEQMKDHDSRDRVGAMRALAQRLGSEVYLTGRDAAKAFLIKGGMDPVAAEEAVKSRGMFLGNVNGKKVVLVMPIEDPNTGALHVTGAAGPHEIQHIFQAIMGTEGNRVINQIIREDLGTHWDAAGQSYTRRAVGAIPVGTTWQEHLVQSTLKVPLDQAGLSPEQIRAEGDRILATELAADTYDALVQHGGGKLMQGKGATGRIARILAKTIAVFGGEPFDGSVKMNEAFDPTADALPITYRAAEAVREQTLKATPPDIQSKAARPDVAPDATVAGTRKTFEEAAAKGNYSHQIEYLGGPREQDALRTEERLTAHGLPDADRVRARRLFATTLNPDGTVRFINTNEGPQVVGVMMLDRLRNADLLVGMAAKAKRLDLIPYETNGVDQLTPAGWHQLLTDQEGVTWNHEHGWRGDGKGPVVNPGGDVLIPRDTMPKDQQVLIPQERADFINALNGASIALPPITMRKAQKGIEPANTKAQRTATASGAPDIQPRVQPIPDQATFFQGDIEAPITGKDAAGNPVEYLPRAVTNPLVAQMLKAGLPLNELPDASARLGLRHIKSVMPRADLKIDNASADVTRAGFSPARDRAPIWRSNIHDALAKAPDIFEAKTYPGRTIPGRRIATRPGEFKDIPEQEIPAKTEGIAEQVRTFLDRFPGAREQAAWVGLDEFLQDKPTATKQEILDFVAANDVQVSEVVKGGKLGERYAPELAEKINDLSRQIRVRREDASNVYGPDRNKWPQEVKAPIYDLIKQHQDAVAERDALAERRAADYGDYQLEGGKDYRELLLTLPSVSKQPGIPTESFPDFLRRIGADPRASTDTAFQDRYLRERKRDYIGSHFQEPNVVAHVRFNERTDAEGNRVLFLEEIQSDMHQEGRKEGYKLPAGERAALATEWEALSAKTDKTAEESTRLSELTDRLNVDNDAKVPSETPFKKSWPMLAFRRMVKWAVDNGFDKIAWTSGEQQAARYDLRKRIDSLEYQAEGDGFAVLARKGKKVLLSTTVAKDKLSNTVGKSLASKILAGEGVAGPEGFRTLTGKDLAIGGEGMQNFYDELLPAEVNKFAKRFGGKVGETQMATGGDFSTESFQDYMTRTGLPPEQARGSYLANRQKVSPPTQPQMSLDITPAMREAAAEGVSQFSPARDRVASPEDTQGRRVSQPFTTYDEAARQTDGNPWVRSAAEASNADRVLLVQFSSDLINAADIRSAKDEAGSYYDKLYSGARKGYARLADFWEIPQWIGFASHAYPKSDMYVVRNMAKAKEFLREAGYGRVLMSALEVNQHLIKDLAADYPGKFDVGGYVQPETFKDVPNVRWHDSMAALSKDMGIEHRNGVNYNHFQGSDVIPRLTMSQGCKHKCAFCTVPKNLDVTAPEVVTQQAESIADLGAKLVYLNDKTFGQASNYRNLAQVYAQIKAKVPDFRGFVIQTTASQMVKFDPAWLKESGIKFVELGIETYNDPILHEMHKPATEALMDRSVKALRDAGIALIPNIIIGFPKETKETYARTLAWLQKNADVISHANIYNLALYKEAELGKQIATLSEADFNENVMEKSFHTDPEIHRVFAGDLYGMASKMLDTKPAAIPNFSPRRDLANVEHIRDQAELWSPVRPTADTADRFSPVKEIAGAGDLEQQDTGTLKELAAAGDLEQQQQQDQTPRLSPPKSGDLWEAGGDKTWDLWRGSEVASTIRQNAKGKFDVSTHTDDGWQVANNLPSLKAAKAAAAEMLPTPQAEVEVPAAAATPADSQWTLKPAGTDGISKAFILPDGTPQQLGAVWHHAFLSDNAEDLHGRFGISVEAAKAGEAGGAREAFLRRGAARVNYATSGGTLTVEARASDWPKLQNSVHDLVAANLGKIDNLKVNLLNERATRPQESEAVPLFRLKTRDDKLQAIPFMEGRQSDSAGPSEVPASEVGRDAFSFEQARAFRVDPALLSPRRELQHDHFPVTLERVRAGAEDFYGETFNGDGSKWNPRNKRQDIVTLASRNLAQSEVTPEKVREVMAEYLPLLRQHPGFALGVFKMGDQRMPNGEQKWSVDFNSVVPQQYRDNSVEFARQNNQKAIWDARVGEEIPTDGTGDTVLSHPDDLLKAHQALQAGQSIAVDDLPLLRERNAGTIPGLVEDVEVEDPGHASKMTRSEIARHLPEVFLPKNRKEKLDIADLADSPAFKKAGSEDAGVVAIGDKLVAEARALQDSPSYKDGLLWYSRFVPLLKQHFGENAGLMAEFLAATSPRNNPTVNFQYAVEALWGFQEGRFDKQVAKFLEGMAMMEAGTLEAVYNTDLAAGLVKKAPKVAGPATHLAHWVEKHDLQPKRTNGKLFGAQSDAVLQVLARTWLRDGRGPKVGNFVQNLMGTGHGATVDVWAGRLLRRLSHADYVDKWRLLPPNEVGISDHNFDLGQRVFKYAADKLGIEADALQGAMWFAEKTLWADKGWQRLNLGDYVAEIPKLPELRRGHEGKPRKEVPEFDFALEPSYRPTKNEAGDRKKLAILRRGE